ncbi:uncharacterized protein LOC21408589 [Morus notabilis]|uniref:uncharacterized protein LOC21408589 n=1 Tax=Morus notabilis TaxID=981085 RepID=UPI000CED2CED|nr:uncharacterized protein LOC21408589 [Morus notabilis]
MERKSEAAKPCFKTLSCSSKIEPVSTIHSQKIQKLKSGVYNEDDESESFSDIDDAEVCKYLNNKKEARYKRMIWEAMNKDHQKGSKEKRARKATKDDPTKEVVKPARKMDNEKRLNSKINYDMLNKLNHDEVHKMDNGEDVGDHCGHHVEMQLINDKSNSEVYSSGDDNENAIDPENGGC